MREKLGEGEQGNKIEKKNYIIYNIYKKNTVYTASDVGKIRRQN